MFLPQPTLINKQSGGARCILKITCDITEPFQGRLQKFQRGGLQFKTYTVETFLLVSASQYVQCFAI